MAVFQKIEQSSSCKATAKLLNLSYISILLLLFYLGQTRWSYAKKKKCSCQCIRWEGREITGVFYLQVLNCTNQV